jgi:hypothetical protein
MNICVYLLKEIIFSKYIGMNVKEKPPDKYQCIKVPIQRILKKDTNTLEIINDAVSRTNYITTKSYFLLRLWVLQKYHNNQDIPHITEDTIKMSMKSLVKASAGPKAKGNNLLLLQEFQQLHSFSLEDGKNLSATLDYYSTTMITAIENNIKMHFMDYVKRFVNSYFKSIHKEEIQNKEFKKQLYKELQAVKNDIINNTTTSEPKYQTWLNENRYKIVPQEYDTSYYYDIKVNPQRYLKYMIFMNLQLEEKEAKMFQFFPLQTQIIPRHIQLDTKSIIDLLVDTDKKQYLDNVEKHKEILWDKYFTIKQYLRKYDFDYTIITDGYAVSLRFLHKDFAKEERIKKDKMKNGKKALKGLTNEEKKTKKQEKITQQNKIKEENKQKRVLETKQRKEQNIKINKEPKKETQQEFPYIDEVETKELEGKHIFIDPGKRSLLTMMDDDGNYLSYTNKHRICETKRMKYQALLKNYKYKLSITPKENTLSLFNSKTCNLEKFKEYITEKIKVNQELYTLYQNEKFRQYKWYAYINKKRTEDNMLNKIENKYGKDVKIIIGDWSIGKQMRNFISTPNLTIKRKLTTRFQVYNIDEFRTSCLNYITEEVCKNLYLPDKKKIQRKMRSILTYKMENNRKGCINRDKNGCRNIQKVFKCYMETGERPEKYRREYKFNKID